MKKIVTNPAWLEARYEMGYLPNVPGFDGPRTNTPPPTEGFKDANAMIAWMKQHEIPRYITIETES